MDWKISRFKAGQPRRWEFLLPPGSAKETEALLKTIVSDPFLPRTHVPEFKVFPEKFILEKTNFRQALEVLARIPWIRDFRLNLGKFYLDGEFSFDGLLEQIKASKLLPENWGVRFHPQVRGRAEVSREDLQSLWEDSYSEPSSEKEKQTELNALMVGEDLVLSISLAGEPLFKRGNFSPLSKSAPMREDSAVFLLSLLEKKSPDPDAIFVPFAGSGTFVWESISLLNGLSFPHYDRSYLFQDLEEFPSPTWEFLKKRLSEIRSDLSLRVWWNDLEEDVCSYLEERGSLYQKFIKSLGTNAKLMISGELGDFFSFSPKEVWNSMGSPKKIWMPLNPPYGLRIKNGSNAGLYRRIAETLKEWWALPTDISGFILCPDEESWSVFQKSIGNKLETVHITHGGIDLRVVFF
ncbi:hypothetical protein EHQ53_05420 [Leptospira langatensis]|uniref:Uncharacterized protein n=1 Tax=Leptospira langatensis TaxID=2484983 RepID=A0A5F1ZT94_9LEPT|nr:hypothetical protein [Leptospira langatensis]TGK02908.1 hypothetical protein EHO57_06255 [Leptospira langatensis]TGL41663.1 hypothetical protein EHQ53_05420 [Leptospira langatensis]